MAKNLIHIALVGNPNSGKTSLFNSLTGLNQKVGNFPGVTVDKKTGSTSVSETLTGNIIDLPGTYSLYPKRLDEWVSYRVLLNQDKEVKADIFVIVVDASNLKRNLLFCSQIIDLKKPTVVALSMADLAKKKGIQIDIQELERELGVPVVSVNPRRGKGITQLKKAIELTASTDAGGLSEASACSYFFSTAAILPEGPKELSAHKTRLMIMMIFPASKTKIRALFTMACATFFSLGDL